MNRRRILWLAAVAAVGVLLAAHPLWLAALGSFLVRAEAPVPADAVLVLGGDSYGHRVLKGGELARQGYAPRVYVSGGPGYYGVRESELAIAFAVRHGYPQPVFVPIPHRSLSTREEAQRILPDLRRQGVRRLLLVTSDYHTRRAGSIFRSVAPDLAITVVASRDEVFTPGGWWRTREGRKTVYYEVTKTIADWIGL